MPTYTQIKNDKGEYATVSDDKLNDYISQGYHIADKNNNADIARLAELQKQQAMESLRGAKDSALSSLGTERAKIKPRFYDARNAEAASNQQQARNFAEFMANRGGTTAGSNAQATMVQNGVYQGNLGALKRQETEAYTDIARRESDVENQYKHDLAAAEMAIQAQMIQQQMAESRYQDEMDYRDRQDSRQNFLDTIGQYYGDYQAQINKVKNDGDPSNDWQLGYLGAARQDKINGLKQLEQQMAAAKSKAEAEAIQQKFENDLKQKQYELDLMKTKYDISKPHYKPSTPKASTTSYKTNPGFASDLQQVYANPAGALNSLKTNAQSFIAEYGYDGYMALLKAADAASEQ